MLVSTDIKEFASKDIRKMLIEFIFKYFPKGEITISELATFFKIPTHHPQEPQSANTFKKQNATFDGKAPQKFPS